jgi:dihydrofolate reductase
MISMIAAMAENRVIGKDGGMPWHLPGDLRFFKETTYGKTVVMGRKTYESIGKPLPGRKNVVMTSRTNFQPEGVTVVHTKEDVLQLEKKEQELVIMGGATLYEAFMPEADRLYLTRIEKEFSGDTFFPEFNESEWETVEERRGEINEKNQIPHMFQTLERKVDSSKKV